MLSTRIFVALGLVLCAVAVASCAGETGDDAARPEPSSTTPAGAVLPDDRAIGLKPHVWTRYDVLAGTGLRIHYTITGSPQCNVLGRVDVAESADIVTVTLHIGRLSAASCAAKILKATELFTELELTQPLGTRSAEDGSV